ncbi:MAG TPA: ABC transporter ATP-binding protein [Clostridia bacterium]|nr:ABC transporter ATP-binding protein [Clostridia bacterium]
MSLGPVHGIRIEGTGIGGTRVDSESPGNPGDPIPMVKVRVHGVTFAYASRKVLSGVDIEIQKGDFLAVVGPNGSGKSTLLKVISGALRPIAGSVLVNGKEVTRTSHKTRAQVMAFLGQMEHTDFPFTALDVVLLGRYCHQKRFQKETPRDLSAARRAMELTQSSHLASRPIDSLSGGERQRVLIARALAQEPEILLLDEPTTFLDISSQVGILNLLKRLNEDYHMTIIAVFHDLNLASGYARKVLMLDAGRVYAFGSPAEVLTERNIQNVYKTRAIVQYHPTLGLPYVVFDPTEENPTAPTSHDKATGGTTETAEDLHIDPCGGIRSKQYWPQMRIHVVGGGGTATELLHALAAHGINTTIGVLNIGDSDWMTARSLKIGVIEAPPFSPIGREVERLEEVVLEADYTVVTEVPFGPGNLPNLLALRSALERSAMPKVGLIGDENTLSGRDWTEGLATSVYRDLITRGCRLFPDTNAALDYIRTVGLRKASRHCAI